MFCVRFDGLDDQVKFIGAVDLARYAVIAMWRDLLGFGEVIQAIDPVRRVIFHEEHGAGAVLGPGDQDEMIGAEVKHCGCEEGPESSDPASSAVEGLPGGLLRAGYHHSAAPS